MLLIDRTHSRSTPFLVVGDSHACFLLGSKPLPIIDSGTADAMSFWLGPRLIYSTACHGWRLSIRQRLALRRLNVDCLLVVRGEIDARVFLAREPADRYRNRSWVTDFVRRVQELSVTTEAERVCILGPTPQSDLGSDNPEFPRVGRLNERIMGSMWLSSELEQSVRSLNSPSLTFLDFREALADSVGALRSELTSDGIHLNRTGTAIVWQEVRMHLERELR